jgi:release factor glutamine methyltransferase
LPERTLGVIGAPSPTCIGDGLRAATARLARAGCDTPRLDAELLLAEVLGCDRAQLVLDARSQLDADAAVAFDALLARRRAREPVAYILGRKAFRTITLAVDPQVLIPRPETELLVEVGSSLPIGARVADVGTGSGAVALALKAERPDLSVLGSDISAGALTVARGNAAALALDVEFVQADLLPTGRYDAVLANLPYVSRAELVGLAPEIRDHEPPGALDGGADGLDVIRRLLAVLAGDRVDGLDGEPVAGIACVRLAALEVGADQSHAVAGLVADAGFGSVERQRDLAGHERVVVGRR